MTARWLLVRHGETIWAGSGRYAGWCDIPLSDLGREQSHRLGARLTTQPLRAAYTSPLRRARETLDLLLTGHPERPPVHAAPDLRELHFGSWEGRTYAEIAADPSGAAVLAGERAAPGGECLADLATRVARFLDHLQRESTPEPAEDASHAAAADTSEPAGTTTLVVTHGGPLRVLLCLLLGLPLAEHWRFQVDYASLTEVSWNPSAGARLVRLNDCSHLGGLPDRPLVSPAPGTNATFSARTIAPPGEGHR